MQSRNLRADANPTADLFNLGLVTPGTHDTITVVSQIYYRISYSISLTLDTHQRYHGAISPHSTQTVTLSFVESCLSESRTVLKK